MDESQFDGLAKRLAGFRFSRLTAMQGLLAGVLAGVSGAVLPTAESKAARRGGKHRARRKGRPERQKKPARGRGRNERAGVQAEKKNKKKCPRGLTRCGSGCANTASDAANCGGCGATCAAGQSCQGETCTCNGERCSGCCDGTICQSGTSEARCGSSGIACLACGEGETCCNGACRHLSTDVDHCETWGNACCTPTACAARGKNCGALDDGCGGTLLCIPADDDSRCWVLAGGEDPFSPAARIRVGDDLSISVNEQLVAKDDDGQLSEAGPFVFPAEPGDSLRIVATDVGAGARELGRSTCGAPAAAGGN